jgi:hypothetical protein
MEPQGKRTLAKVKSRWNDNIQMDFKGILHNDGNTYNLKVSATFLALNRKVFNKR